MELWNREMKTARAVKVAAFEKRGHVVLFKIIGRRKLHNTSGQEPKEREAGSLLSERSAYLRKSEFRSFRISQPCEFNKR
jgi:hypothetical protein